MFSNGVLQRRQTGEVWQVFRAGNSFIRGKLTFLRIHFFDLVLNFSFDNVIHVFVEDRRRLILQWSTFTFRMIFTRQIQSDGNYGFTRNAPNVCRFPRPVSPGVNTPPYMITDELDIFTVENYQYQETEERTVEIR